jgi:hypothetical protein
MFIPGTPPDIKRPDRKGQHSQHFIINHVIKYPNIIQYISLYILPGMETDLNKSSTMFEILLPQVEVYLTF